MISLKRILFGGLIAGLSIISVGCGTTPDPGQTIVRVYKVGDQAGFDKATIVTGSYNPNELNAVFYSLSNRISTYVYTNSVNEGKAIDESISFKTSDNFNIKVNVAIAYSIVDPLKFLAVQKNEDEALTSVLYVLLRDKINNIGNSYLLNDLVNIPGSNKTVNTAKTLTDFQNKVLEEVNKEAKTYGVSVSKITFVNGFYLPPEISDQVLKAQQQIIDIQKQTSLSASKAAQYDNELKAANAKLQLSKAEAQARVLESQGLTPEYIALKAIEKWNGDATLVKINTK